MKNTLLLLLLCCSLQSLRAATVDTISIPSAAMHRSYKCVVVTPDSYKKGKQRYPVVYLLHGYSGNYASWITKMPAAKDLADTYQCVMVFPDGAFGSWYLDSPMDSSMRFETYVSKEIPAYIDQRYKTLPDSKHRAITGFSMGGHGALYLAMRHPDVFGVAGSMSGGVDIRPFPKSWELVKLLGEPGKDGVNWTPYTVMDQVDRLKPGVLSMIIDCGVKDFFIDVNRALNKKLLEKGIDHDYTERPGQHDWPYWSNSTYYHMLYFHRFFNK
ncbi:alpha/beta hydrolase [Chitinophaga qingshengii]|uniref:Esterase family protein n=1 Tax=Chitinophaga qingshengii TaxID=1569794 RepID=A0ABR7TU93_9BACT|nr:alpha/beta hydrolase family protein [Chitinophaga qingshengii]MBC9932544.1 esterase family protein [Chitinophaga qingshengii]